MCGHVIIKGKSSPLTSKLDLLRDIISILSPRIPSESKRPAVQVDPD